MVLFLQTHASQGGGGGVDLAFEIYDRSHNN